VVVDVLLAFLDLGEVGDLDEHAVGVAEQVDELLGAGGGGHGGADAGARTPRMTWKRPYSVSMAAMWSGAWRTAIHRQPSGSPAGSQNVGSWSRSSRSTLPLRTWMKSSPVCSNQQCSD
jgi:hypothetical protein